MRYNLIAERRERMDQIKTGRFISQERKSRNLTQKQLAEKLNISLRSYSNLEHGVSFCSALSLINYVNNCNVDKDKLFSTFAEIMNDAENQ